MLFDSSYQPAQPARVVVTGLGIITALGNGKAANAEGFRTGRVAIGPVSLFDASRQRVRIAGEVRLPEELPSTMLGRSQARRMDRAGRILLHAAAEALSQSGWSRPLSEVPVVLGTTSGGMSLGEAYYRQVLRKPLSLRGQSTRVVHYQAHRQGLDLVEAFGLGGPLTIIANACASGANAVGHAWELIRTGRTHRVLTGGYEALSHLVFAGFDSLQALAPEVCRPFDANRDGLALGEGAAVLALETIDSAKRRGAPILAEIAGYGSAMDVHHLTQPHPEGSAALASMRAACEAAAVEPRQIDYINAHGTGTPLNDSAEATAINLWAGESAGGVRVSSTKGGVGHLLGAAGAVETAVCVMALQGQWLPPNTNLRTPDAVCRFPLVTCPCESKLEYALSNSFGFGGANATLVFRRWK